jgi:hypothetical protein
MAATTVEVPPPPPLPPRVPSPLTSTPRLTLFKCGQVSGGGVGVQQPHLHLQAMLVSALLYSPPPQVGLPFMPPLMPLPIHRGQQQAPALAAWSPWTGSWDQQSLANFFNTMIMVPPVVTDWMTDSDASNHTTSNAGNLTSIHLAHINDPSSIIVGNRSSVPVTSVGDTTLFSSFYLNNVLVISDIIQNLLSVHRFTTDKWCSMELDPFGLSMKDLSTRNMITRCDSLGPLYTMRPP